MKKRKIAVFLALILVLAVALSAFATVMEATHDCSGGDCDICGILKAILNITRIISLSLCLIVMSAVSAAASSFSQTIDRFTIHYASPVTQKVKLLT